jgi:thiosulfate/3-mercaptopyruvate sulfurtransferase
VSSGYIPIDRISSITGTLGVDPGKEIIAYADKGSACPYFILVSLELVGAKNIHVYHGGIDDWKTAGRPIATTVTTLPPVTLDLHPISGIIVSTYEVNANLTDRKAQILDVRTPDEFVGLDIRALRGGHIPHAVNIPYEQNWIDPESLIKVQKKQVANNDGFALKTREDLKLVYAKLDPALKTIVYCQNSLRASVTATVLKDLGFRDVMVYDRSWAGYGNYFVLPAENETFFDMFALTNRIGTMQQRIDILEKRLDDLKAKRK